jgi:tetratricopeptide (TPR) repeat protein
LWLLLASVATAQTSSVELKSLFEAGRLQEVVAAGADTSADGLFYRGLALAKLQRSNEAQELFLTAQQSFPSDPRFPEELAGLAFQAKDNRSAVHYLRRALRVNPNDEYAAGFLASLYLLQGNLDAAVKYCNRVGKPEINEIRFQPETLVNPVLLDRNLTISPKSVLHLDDLKTSEARIEALQVFSSPQYVLQAKPDGQFEFIVRAVTKNGFGNSKPEVLLRLLRGLPYQTIYPEYFNAGGMAKNITSILRWDSNKRRFGVSISSPSRDHPSLHYRMFADARDENWALSSATTSGFGFHSHEYTFGAALDQIISGKWRWGTSTALVHEGAPLLAAPQLFTDGASLQYKAYVERQLLSVPENRLSITAKVSPTIGRNFGSSSTSFARIHAATELKWLPGARSGDYEIGAQISGVTSTGTLPFSELSMLGVERDNDLLLRGHPGTRDGRKGSAPLAREYALGNFDFTRRVFNNGFIDLKVGPFVDVARPWRTIQAETPAWLVDPGISLKVRVLGSATVTLSYGRNLHDGRNAFYATALR